MIEAKIIKFSSNNFNDKLITYELIFPTIILPEILTHRMASKNTSSNRAIPFNKMVKMVEETPFIPIAFQKHHKGMQGNEYIIDKNEIKKCVENWIKAKNNALDMAKTLYEKCGITKQLANRLLVPFQYTKMLFTISEQGLFNFFNLRCPKYYFEYTKEYCWSKKEYIEKYNDYILTNNIDSTEDFSTWDFFKWESINNSTAEIHIQDLAEKMYDNFRVSVPENLKEGQWHIPYEQEIREMYKDEKLDLLDIIKISVSISARTSYTSIEEGKILPVNRHLELYEKLITSNPPHSSPLEHIGCVMKKSKKERRSGNFTGYKQLRHIVENNKLKKYFKNNKIWKQ